jgi:transglutaminase superfamily protein/uncharacterized protein DUF3857
MKSRSSPYLPAALLLCLLISAKSTLAAADDWKPIDSAQLALKSSIVEKDADAEALFWEVRIVDVPHGDLLLDHYLRVKVFTEHGRELQSRIDLPFGNIFGEQIKIQNVAARTIKADGSIVEVNEQDIFDRTIIKTNGLTMKARSFALPAVERGCIIEYRWREVRVNRDANYIRIDFQRDIPVQRVQYRVKPRQKYDGQTFSSITLRGRSTSTWVKEKDGFFSIVMDNMPAVHEEPYMPPENQIKTWMLIYYQRWVIEPDPEQYWLEAGKYFYEATKSLIAVNDEIKQLSATLTAGAKSDEQKVERLFEYCRNKIKNLSHNFEILTSEERARLSENAAPADTLRRGAGDAGDIDRLFAALANASGFEARIVLMPDRGNLFFDKSLPNLYFIRPASIGVKIGSAWNFFNPGSYLPLGMLEWQREGQQVLITDPKEPVWVNTPLSPYQKSLARRKAKLKLTDDGTLEGDARIELTGHLAIQDKESLDKDTEAQRDEWLRQSVKTRISTAELWAIKIENVTDPANPLTLSYHVRVPGYAQRTGKRLFVHPAFFQHGLSPLFSSSTRQYSIYFHYPWSEDDQVEIELPEGYVLDNTQPPESFANGRLSEYKVTLTTSSDSNALIYKRSFYFGAGGSILFPVENYQPLKNYFDLMHKQDNHTVALKQTATSQ